LYPADTGSILSEYSIVAGISICGFCIPSLLHCLLHCSDVGKGFKLLAGGIQVLYGWNTEG